MNRFRVALAKNLKRARSEQHLTQQELAERCGLSTNYLATVEIGGKFPSADTLEKLARGLGLKPYQFFLDDGDVEAFDHGELIARYRTVPRLRDGGAGTGGEGDDVDVLIQPFRDVCLLRKMSRGGWSLGRE